MTYDNFVFVKIRKLNIESRAKLLFICSQNRWRSLTAEKIFSENDNYQVKSAGTEKTARVKITEGMIGWADMIFVMENHHREKLKMKFPDKIRGKKIVVLHIPDEFQLMDEQLIEIFKERLLAYNISVL